VEQIETKIENGDCLDVLKNYPDNFFNLIVTSPPYADSRSKTYGGIKPDAYVEWFLPRAKEFLRVLRPDGTFILNIKEKAVNGERHTYVLELILALRKQGWLWTEEFVWHKKNCFPGKWPNRFRDAWERCLQFNKSEKFNMYQNEVMVPMGDWAKTRLKKLSKTDKTRDESKVNSGFGKNVSNWLDRDMAYPSNVLHFATECYNKSHSAVFPKDLPAWFIKLFTKEHDWVLDPFSGSGTTAEVAQKSNRNSVGVEILPEYCTLASERTTNYKLRLCENKAEYETNNSTQNSGVCQATHPGVPQKPNRKVEETEVQRFTYK
jgi:DNA modification methylase